MRFRNLTAFLPLAAVVYAAIPAIPAFANDTEAGVALGGLTLLQSDNISMDSEDLYISGEQVRVKYRFTNTSRKDIATMVAFPLPEQRLDSRFANNEDEPDIDPKDLNFKTTVDGKPAVLTLRTVAKLNGATVNSELETRGLPITWDDQEKFFQVIDRLAASDVEKFVAEGFLRRNKEGEVVPAWTVTRAITRNQTFPAGKTVRVSHTYTPAPGGSVAGGLTASDADVAASYRKKYCVDKDFIASTKRKSGPNGGYGETWIDYVLSSGANWKGPIKDFRLVVDKGREGSLVSLCMTGIKKISATQFEVRKKNFEPKKDLAILIVNFAS